MNEIHIAVCTSTEYATLITCYANTDAITDIVSLLHARETRINIVILSTIVAAILHAHNARLCQLIQSYSLNWECDVISYALETIVGECHGSKMSAQNRAS